MLIRTHETDELILFSDSDSTVHLLDKQSLNDCKIETKMTLEEIADHPKIKKLLTSFRTKPLLNSVSQINVIYLFVTNQCNFSCYYCSAGKKENSPVYNIDNNKFKEHILPFLIHLKPKKIIITGGEPCLNTDIIDIINSIIQEIETKIVIQTNAFYLHKIANDIIENVSEINISCNGYFEDHYDLKILENVIKYDKDKFTLSFVVNNKNTAAYYEFIEFACVHDVRIYINFLSPIGSGRLYNHLLLNDEEKSEILYKTAQYTEKHSCLHTSNFIRSYLYASKSCGAYGRKLTVASNGNIYLCQCMTEENNFIGNVNENSIQDIMNQYETLINSQHIRRMFCVDENEKCSSCPYRYYCAGRCYAVQYYNNSYLYSCEFNKQLIEFSMFYRNHDDKNTANEFIRYIDEHKN